MQAGHEFNCSSKDNERINTASVPLGEGVREQERERDKKEFGTLMNSKFFFLLSLPQLLPHVIRFELVQSCSFLSSLVGTFNRFLIVFCLV